MCRLNDRLFGKNGFSTAMQTIAYDILYGEREVFGGVAPSKKTTMKMGLYDIVIDDVYVEDGQILVIGKNFTEYSTVFIGPWKQDTEFVSSTHIICDDAWIFLSDSIYVAQVASDLEKLSVTEDFIMIQ